MSQTVTVRVPASTSNLGAGFDCVGVAVDRWLEVTVTLPAGQGGFTVARRGTLTSYTGDASNDRLVGGFVAACRQAARDVPDAVAFAATSTIPLGRGLGSSAAATIAGALAANALLELGLGESSIAALCTELEGHPDNAAPALFGGARLAVTAADGSLLVAPLQVHDSLALVFAIPGFSIATADARAVLPAVVSHATATRAAALGAALVQGLATGDGGLLAAALDDVLHVPFRRSLIAGYDAVTRAARDAGAHGATISGSGSTIIAIAPVTAATAVGQEMVAAWKALGIDAESLVNPATVGGASARAGDGARVATSSPRPRKPAVTT